MKGIYTILLLIVSNVFMTFAWYGHFEDETGIYLVCFSSVDRCKLLLAGQLLSLSIRVKYRRIVSGLSVMEARLH